MKPEKLEKYTDLFIEGRDVENYPTAESVNVCNVCFAVVAVEFDYWEKHIAWHKEVQGESTETTD